MSLAVSPLTRREITFYFLFAALLLLAMLLTGIVFWAVTPPRNLQRVGALADFLPSVQPYPVTVGDRWIWLVNFQGELLALNPRLVTFEGSMRCDVHWVPTNRRFEDPCSGAKLRLDGVWLDPDTNNVFQPAKLRPQGLERYRIEVRDDEIWVDLAVATPGPILTGAPTPFGR